MSIPHNDVIMLLWLTATIVIVSAGNLPRAWVRWDGRDGLFPFASIVSFLAGALAFCTIMFSVLR